MTDGHLLGRKGSNGGKVMWEFFKGFCVGWFLYDIGKMIILRICK
jgi:hypothetical protein